MECNSDVLQKIILSSKNKNKIINVLTLEDCVESIKYHLSRIEHTINLNSHCDTVVYILLELKHKILCISNSINGNYDDTVILLNKISKTAFDTADKAFDTYYEQHKFNK